MYISTQCVLCGIHTLKVNIDIFKTMNLCTCLRSIHLKRVVPCVYFSKVYQIAKFMGPTWGPRGSCRHQMGPMLPPWTLLSGLTIARSKARSRILDDINLSTKLEILDVSHKVVLQRPSCLRRLVYETFGTQIGIKHRSFILDFRLRQFVNLATSQAVFKSRSPALSLTPEDFITITEYIGWLNKYPYGFVWDVIFNTCTYIDCNSAKLLLNLIHGGVITLKVSIMNHRLVLGHETMVHALCLTICYSSSNNF